MAIRAYAVKNEVITPEDYARMQAPVQLPFRVVGNGHLRPTVGSSGSVTIRSGTAFVGGTTVEVTGTESVAPSPSPDKGFLMLVVDWKLGSKTGAFFEWAGFPYGKYQPGVRVEVPILHLISTGARAEYADLRVWGGMGGPLLCDETGFKNPFGIMAPPGTFLVEESTGGLTTRPDGTFQDRVKIMNADGFWEEVSGDASAASVARSVKRAEAAADRADSITSTTKWNGDKLTVNGKTSPSLTGPQGKPGPPGEGAFNFPGASIVPADDSGQLWANDVGVSPAFDSKVGRFYTTKSDAKSIGVKRRNLVMPYKVKYRVGLWIKADKPGSTLFIELRDQNGVHAVKSGSIGSGGNYLVNNLRKIPTEWTWYESDIELNEGVSVTYLDKFYFNHPSGEETNAAVSLSDIFIAPVPPHTHALRDISDAPNSHTSDATASTLMSRDGAGRTSVADPSSEGHAVNKKYLDKRLAEVGKGGAEVESRESRYGYMFCKIGKLVILNVEYAVIGRQPEIMEIPFGYAPAKSVKFYVTYKTPQGVVGLSEVIQRDNYLEIADGGSIPKGSFISGTGMWMAK